jgi:hypothetical protein
MTPTRQGSWSRRLKNAALFVGIVWALAGSFVAFELLALFATQLAILDLGNLALSQATQESTACDVQTGEAAERSGALSPSEAPARAWLLGMNVGRDAQSRQWVDSGSKPDQDAIANVKQLTDLLAVPAPGTFAAEQIASANTEFVSFVENDAAGTAHALALRYSPDACRVYKLGAFWGYSVQVRVSLPGEPSIYRVEINYYGRQVGLPEELIQMLIAPTSANASRRELAIETVALTEAVITHLGGVTQEGASP